jgi:predicted phage-related endonuclease
MNNLITIENNEIIVAQEVCEQIANFEKQALKIKLLEDELKEKIKIAMEENNLTMVKANGLKIAYRKASTRTSLDTKLLKEQLPDIYEEYSKTSDVSSSISISVE